jgi:pyridoxine 4-dehydrogenase
MAISGPVNAAAAGTWRLGDLTVNRMGFGAMRLPQNGRPSLESLHNDA